MSEASAVADAARMAAEANGQPPASAEDRLRTRGIIWERVRPLRWLWRRRIPLGLLSILLGEEGVGKGTLASWLVAQTTRGALEGELHGTPVNAMIVGDEDAFEQIWVPRLYAAGADMERLRTLDDGEFIDDFGSVSARLAATIREDEIGLVVFDALIDHVPASASGSEIYNPKAVREALKPLRRVIAATDAAAIGLMHPIKGNPTSFRQLMAASHQFNAVSRSSLLLAKDPENESRRVLVRGKGNHSAEPKAVEFSIQPRTFELNTHGFEMPMVVDVRESERTIDDLLRKDATPDTPARDRLVPQLREVLVPEPGLQLKEIAEAVGCGPKDGSMRRALAWMEKNGQAKRVNGRWCRP
jgi:hypothetical protein